MFRKHKKIFTILLSVLTMAVPLVARASWWQDAFTWIIHAITAAIVWIIGLFLTLGASLTDLMLQINIDYLNSSNKLIETGWQITRDLANLGFVLAIIIIAFATIVQYKQYGAKKLLPKLIAAALIVNFSMAIATPVIGFSNTITNFFLGSASPAVSGPGKAAGVIAGAFDPQKLIMDPTEVDPTIPPGMEEGKTGGFGSVFLVSIASGLFAITFTIIATITFFAFAFMLMIRYVALAFLLILAPIAWLAWVIPGLENQFSKWWSNFFKWSFFAPAMSFFIYLALISAEQMKSENMTAITGKNFAVGTIGNLMVHGSQMVIIAGLMIGGLIAAQNLGIHGSKGAMGIAKKVGNWGRKGAARVARRGALRAGSKVFRPKGEEGKSLAERARSYAQNRKTFVGKWGAGLAAKGLTNLESLGTEKLTKEFEKEISKESDTQSLASLPGSTGAKKVERMKKLAKNKKLHKANVQNLVTSGSKRLFNRYGQKGKWEDIEKAAGMSTKVNEELQSYLKDKSKGTTELSKAINEFAGGLKKKDLANMPLGDIYSGKAKLGFKKEDLEEFSNIFSKGVAEANHVLTPNIIPKFNSEQRDNFEKSYRAAIEELKKTNPKKAEDVKERFENTLSNYASGQEAPAPAGGGGEGGASAGGGS